MDLGTIAGYIIGAIAVFGVACQWDLAPYIDVPSVAIVGGGLISTVLISVPMHKIKRMPKSFLIGFMGKSEELESKIVQLVQLSEMARKEGILALESIVDQLPDPFLKQGLQLAVDGIDPEIISEIMNTKIDGIQERHEENKRAWEIVRGGGPSWGAIGTVIGLVQMVKGGVEDPNALISGIAVALLTTLYGSLIASWLIGPVCDKLAERSADEILLKTIITRGVMSIQAGDAPRVVEQKLRVFQGGWKTEEKDA